MTVNRVSASLSPADQKAVLDAIATIKQKLPFLTNLAQEERNTLPRMGDKSRAFVSKALEVAAQNPDFLPRSFDVDEMRSDVQLFEAMQPLTLALTQLQELVNDTPRLRWAAKPTWRPWRFTTMPAPAATARPWMRWPTSLAVVSPTKPPPPPPRPNPELSFRSRTPSLKTTAASLKVTVSSVKATAASVKVRTSSVKATAPSL
jgi:hypothetical protein